MSEGGLGGRPVPARCARMTLVHALTLIVDVKREDTNSSSCWAYHHLNEPSRPAANMQARDQQNLVMSSASGQQIGEEPSTFASEAVVAAVAVLSVRPEMVR